MLDILFVFGSIAFFALMIAYVAACERLGESADEDQTIADITP